MRPSAPVASQCAEERDERARLVGGDDEALGHACVRVRIGARGAEAGAAARGVMHHDRWQIRERSWCITPREDAT